MFDWSITKIDIQILHKWGSWTKVDTKNIHEWWIYHTCWPKPRTIYNKSWHQNVFMDDSSITEVEANITDGWLQTSGIGYWRHPFHLPAERCRKWGSEREMIDPNKSLRQDASNRKLNYMHRLLFCCHKKTKKQKNKIFRASGKHPLLLFSFFF